MESAVGRFFYDDNDELESLRYLLSTALICSIIGGILATSILWFFSGSICKWFLGDTFNLWAFRIAIITVPLTAIYNQFIIVLRLMRKPWVFLLLNVSFVIISFILVILFIIYLEIGLQGYFLANLCTTLVCVIICFIYLKSFYRILFSRKHLKKMLKYSLPQLPSVVANWCMTSFNRFIMVGYLSRMDIGLFAIGSKVASIAMVIVSVFRMAWDPLAISIYKTDNAKEIYVKAFEAYGTVVVLGVALIGFFSKEILTILTTPEYYGASLLTSVLVLQFLAQGFTNIVGIGISIEKKTHILSYAMILALLILLICSYILIPIFGAMGAAWANVMGAWTAFVIVYLFAQRFYPVNYQIRLLLKWITFYLILITIGNLIVPVYLSHQSYIFVIKLIIFMVAGVFYSFFIVNKNWRDFLITKFSNYILNKSSNN
ncbi:hypothetical protein Swol_0722 [Syntrophomonas wolfei subsp. wolfei str. Goettingen G311]|uniref:Uncharacterized protein n=1 Tax=Syntrophomonas wolfei subsp. wolfei (strain DSM 2245B / Goettingen) TaxID=335541 RepID=Q0AZ09_SYNWW|nr:hypothetical protein Swol_0722 [Syntrophomonas wolfei subsp. wolfei str. Goettingen G311]